MRSKFRISSLHSNMTACGTWRRWRLHAMMISAATLNKLFIWASPWDYAICKTFKFISWINDVVWYYCNELLPFVMCMLSVIPGIAGTQVFYLYWKVGRYRMVSEHSVACRIETLGLETIGLNYLLIYFKKKKSLYFSSIQKFKFLISYLFKW